MDKEQIINDAAIYEKACKDAQVWVKNNEEIVVKSGKTLNGVAAHLRKEARFFRQIAKAAKRKMCAGVFGPSQAGKSYLLSSLARDEKGDVFCDFNGEQHDFLKEINPAGGKESTGLVTRFTITSPQNVPKDYPVYVRLLSETELVKIFANSFFCDAIHKEIVNKDEIRQKIAALKPRAGAQQSHIDIDAMENLREYITNSFGDKTRAACLEEVFWDDAVELAPKLGLDDRVTLYSIIWNGIEEFTDMLRVLVSDLEKLEFSEELFCSMKALVPREASIIDVDTLGKTDFSKCGASPNVQVMTRSGKCSEISRKNLTAIVAEITMVMVHKPADYFDHTDLLDFPGYKARLEATDLKEYLHSGKADSPVEQFFRRGKVSYLFRRYSDERELTSLLLCNSTTDNIPGLPLAIEEWITSTHGKTPNDRVNSADKTALFYILTKSDRTFEMGQGKSIDKIWDSVIEGQFLAHFGSTFSQTTRWVENWTPTSPFNNMFLLRNINIEWKGMMDLEGSNEIAIRDTELCDKMHQSFINSALVKKHFSNPELAYSELMKLNDGGIGLIKRCLKPLCDPNLKLGQLSNALEIERQKLLDFLSKFFSSGNLEDELKKKKMLFVKIKNFSNNPKFRERFPELLDSFTLGVEQVVYLKDDAERRFEEYKEKFNAIQMEKTQEMANAEVSEENLDLDLDISLDPDSFFDSPSKVMKGGDGNAADDDSHEKDFISFYVERIIEAWSSNCHAKADKSDITSYYMFPAQSFTAMLDEFDEALTRLKINKVIENKFREIAKYTGDESQKNRRQASFAINALNDFISWLGKNPNDKTISAADREIDFNGKRLEVFAPREEFTGYPTLPDTYDPQYHAKKWFMDWLVTFYGMLVDNATSGSSGKINLEQNAVLGKIIKTVNKGQEL
jgi:hypothetical protein